MFKPLLAAACLAACVASVAAQEPAAREPAAAPRPTPIEPLVTWGGAFSLTTADVDAELERTRPDVRRDLRADPVRLLKLLEILQQHRALAAQARELGLDKDPQVQAQISVAVDRVLSTARLEKLSRETKVPDLTQAAIDRYKARPQGYREPERVHVAHVLVSTEKRGEEEARQRAEEVRRLALEGRPFDELAREYSDDPSVRVNGGDLGYLRRGETVKPFDEAAFAMKEPGGVSDLVRTQFGFHVIRFVERKPERRRAFEEVKDDIVAELRERYLNDARQEFLSGIRNDPSIKLDKEAMDRYVARGVEEAKAAAARGENAARPGSTRATPAPKG